MYGDLVNLRTGAIDHQAGTKFLLKCVVFEFHTVQNILIG